MSRPQGQDRQPDPQATVDGWLNRYVPDLADPEHADLIREAVRAIHPATVGSARAAAGNMSGYIMWAADTGLPITAHALFDPDTIDRYVAHAMGRLGYGPKTRMRSHEQLYVLAEANGFPTLPGTRRRFRAPRPVSRPYSNASTDGLIGWADAQRNPQTCHALLAILGVPSVLDSTPEKSPGCSAPTSDGGQPRRLFG